jgi:hypothetical protein
MKFLFLANSTEKASYFTLKAISLYNKITAFCLWLSKHSVPTVLQALFHVTLILPAGVAANILSVNVLSI